MPSNAINFIHFIRSILGSPLRGDASPSGGAKEMLVCQDPKKFQVGDADADADWSTDRHEGWNSYVDEHPLKVPGIDLCQITERMDLLLSVDTLLANHTKEQNEAIYEKLEECEMESLD